MTADVPPGLLVHAFDSAPLAVVATWGAPHRLAYANVRHRGVFGDAPLGTPFRRAFPDLAGHACMDSMDAVLRTGRPQVVTALPVTVHQPGEEHPGEQLFTLCLSSVVAADGQRGVLLVALDVTSQIAEQRRILHRYERLVAAGAQKTWVADPAGRVIESSGWEQVTGLTWDQLRGEGWLTAAHPEDRSRLRASWKRATQEVPEHFEHVYRLRYRDGSYRHCRLRAVPVREEGVVVEWVAGCADIEEEWREERRSSLRARATAVATEAQRAEEAFGALSRVIVPAVADECGIYLLSDVPDHPRHTTTDLYVRRVASTAWDGLPPGLPPISDERVPAASALARAVEERRPLRADFPPGEVPADFAPPGAARWLAEAAAHSGVLVPVLVDGAVSALVSAFVCGRRDALTDEDTALIREILERAHDALRNALELQRTRRVAHALQHSLLTAPPHVPGMQIAARYRASATTADIGGDWYDSFLLPDGVVSLVIGDVAGHDLAAAVTMSKLRNMLRGLAVDRREPPGDIVRRLDLAAQVLGPEEITATCVLCRVEPTEARGWRLHYAVAGHLPPLVVGPDGDARFLEGAHSPLLGSTSPDAPRPSTQEPIAERSTLLLYTDGLVERPPEDIDTSLERLRRHASELATASLEELCEELVTTHNPASFDDTALIALRTAPDPAGSLATPPVVLPP